MLVDCAIFYSCSCCTRSVGVSHGDVLFTREREKEPRPLTTRVTTSPPPATPFRLPPTTPPPSPVTQPWSRPRAPRERHSTRLSSLRPALLHSRAQRYWATWFYFNNAYLQSIFVFNTVVERRSTTEAISSFCTTPAELSFKKLNQIL